MMRPILAANLAGKIIALAVWAHFPWLAVGLFFGPDFVLFYHIFVPSAQGMGRVITHFATERREVWLTIDDGPDSMDTLRILDALDQHRARATFFLIGEKAARHPELVAEIVRRGHEVAHHTHTHPLSNFWCATPARIRKELEDGLAALQKAGVRPQRFRSPVGIKSPFLSGVLAQLGLICIGWSVRSGDCTQRDPNRIVARVMKRIKPGAILLMHEGPSVPAPARVEALAGVLKMLSAQNFACTIPEARQLR